MAPPPDLPMPPLTGERLIFLAEADHDVRYLLYASLTVLTWDHILTFQREVKYIWRAPWTISKALFIFNRYVTAVIIAGNAWISSGTLKGLTDNFCQKWILVTTGLELLCISFVSFVILFRLHAVWGGSRKTFLALLFLWFLSFAGSIVIYFRVVYPVRRFLFHEEYFDICFAVIPNLYLQWLPDALLHILMLSVLIWKAFATPRSNQTQMLAFLYREGIFYYSTTFAVILSGLMIWRFADIAWIGIPLYSGWVLCQLAMSRLLMNIKSSQAFQTQAELIIVGHQHRIPAFRAISPMISVESHGTYGMETIKSAKYDASNSSPAHLEVSLRDGQLACHSGDSRRSLRAIPTATSIRSASPEVIREAEREFRMRQRTRAGEYSGTRWWWLGLPMRQNMEDDRVSVDATVVERWDPGDPGPGMKESRLGRYDHWL